MFNFAFFFLINACKSQGVMLPLTFPMFITNLEYDYQDCEIFEKSNLDGNCRNYHCGMSFVYITVLVTFRSCSQDNCEGLL